MHDLKHCQASIALMLRPDWCMCDREGLKKACITLYQASQGVSNCWIPSMPDLDPLWKLSKCQSGLSTLDSFHPLNILEAWRKPDIAFNRLVVVLCLSSVVNLGDFEFENDPQREMDCIAIPLATRFTLRTVWCASYCWGQWISIIWLLFTIIGLGGCNGVWECVEDEENSGQNRWECLERVQYKEGTWLTVKKVDPDK